MYVDPIPSERFVSVVGLPGKRIQSSMGDWNINIFVISYDTLFIFTMDSLKKDMIVVV